MNLPYFVAQRISKPGRRSFSSVIYRIAIASVALGLAIMLVTFMVLGGFEENIKDKIFSFSGHIQIKKLSMSNSFEEEPLTMEDWREEAIRNDPFVDFIQPYAHKPGLLQKEDEVYGVLYKGITEGFQPSLFEKYLEEGEFISFNDTTFSRDIMVSRRMARALDIALGDRVVVYFVMNPPRTRRFTVKGIYNTALDNFDKNVIIGDLKMINQLNGWVPEEVGGYEVFLKDVEDLERADISLSLKVGIEEYTERVDSKFIQIFEWLDLLRQNVSIFIWLILVVACFNMGSIIFIMVMERTRMIGVFKAIGATDGQIRRIFSYNGIRLVLKGLLYGNLIALAFGLVQDQFRVIPLDPANYYMDYVPIHWNPGLWLLLNLLVLLVVSVVLFFPTAVIARIKPVKAIRFD